MIIIGIDPSTKRPAYSKFAINKAGKFKVMEYAKPEETAMSFWFYLVTGADYVYIENQYLGRNYASAQKLTFSAGELSGIAKLANATVNLVSPSTWQSIVLGIKPRAKREERKKMSKLAASDIVKIGITDDDVADAICIGYYGAKMIGNKNL